MISVLRKLQSEISAIDLYQNVSHIYHNLIPKQEFSLSPIFQTHKLE